MEDAAQRPHKDMDISDLEAPQGEPKSPYSNKFAPSEKLFDKAKLERRKRLADEYAKTLDWGKAAKSVGTSKAKAEKLYNDDESFRQMVQRRLDKVAEELALNDDYVLKELMAIVREARLDKNHRDALKALELLGKHLKLFTDRDSGPSIPISFHLDLGNGEEKLVLEAQPEQPKDNESDRSYLITIPEPEDKGAGDE